MKILSQEEIKELLDTLELEWDYEDDSLQMTVELEDFAQAIDLINDIAGIAEEINHHPNMAVHDYNYVTIITTTHSKQALTDKDAELVKEIEKQFST